MLPQASEEVELTPTLFVIMKKVYWNVKKICCRRNIVMMTKELVSLNA